MFKFFKEKLKGALGIFSKKVEEEAEEIEVIEPATPEKKTQPVILKREETPSLKKGEKSSLPAHHIHQQPPQGFHQDIEKKAGEILKKAAERPKEPHIVPAREEKKEHIKQELIEERSEEKAEKKGLFAKIFGKKEEKREVPHKGRLKDAQKEEQRTTYEQRTTDEVAPVPGHETREEGRQDAKKIPDEEKIHKEPSPPSKEHEEKPSLFRKITETFTTVTLSDKKFEEIFWDLEVVMLENNVAVEVIEKIKGDLRKSLTEKRIPRNSIEDIVISTLKSSISGLFKVEGIDLIREAKKKRPYVIAFIGVNGSGKTTTLAKMAKLFLDNDLTCVIAAADTFRAAAIQQLEEHAGRLGVKLIKQDYKADPAAVAFDAIAHAKAKGIDVVLIDTAGRLHSNDNLMNELKKLIKVNQPDLKVFIGESITGNDCVEQARVFDTAVGIDGIILAKADVDEKGGAAVSVSYVTGKPILYLGTGQKYEDLKKFEPAIILDNLGL